MSNRAIVGTPVSFTADGNTFNPTADAAPKGPKPKYETSTEMSSGRAFHKMVRQSQEMDGLSLSVTSDENEILIELNDRIDPYPMSYKNIAGDVYKGHGYVKIADPRDAQTGVVGITALVDEKGWVLF
jgi:hypothetical protein